MNIRDLLIPVVAAGIAGMPLLRADIQIAGPVLGFYAAPSGNVLQAISGVAGSATLGPSLTTDLDALWVAPDSQSAVGLRGGTLYLMRDIRDITARVPLTAWNGPLDAVVWAGDSNGVIFYSAARQIVQTATALRTNPAVSGEIGIASLGGPLVSLRLSGNPWNAALVVRSGSAVVRRAAARRPADAPQSLYLLPALGAPVPVRGVAKPGPMDFSPDGKSLFVVDENANLVIRVSGSQGQTAEPLALQSPDMVPSDFTDLAVAPDGAHILVLTRKSRSACGIEIASGNTTFCTSLEFSPTGMTRLSGSLYLLDGTASPLGPLWILDSGPGQSFFVPAGVK